MKKKKIAELASILFLLCILCFGVFSKGKKEADYLGKTPLCQMFAFTDKGLLYKDNILIGDMYEFKGLYLRDTKVTEEEDIVISDNYYGSANAKDEYVYFIDYGYNICRFHLGSRKTDMLVKGNGYMISDMLLLNEDIYYLQGIDEKVTNLFAYHLPTGKLKAVLEDVSPFYLYYYHGSVAVASPDGTELMVCDAQEGLTATYPYYEGAILGFLRDGSVILSEDGKIVKANGFDDDKGRILFQDEDLSRVIIKGDEMIFSTVSAHGLIQLYQYDFRNDTYEKLANANHFNRYNALLLYVCKINCFQFIQNCLTGKGIFRLSFRITVYG